MKEYQKEVDLRWSDLDPNFHLRHSVYYDFGAYCRICYLEEHGLSSAKMMELHFGPILFREEAVFRKEIRLGDKLFINLKVLKARKDFSRWSIRHEVLKEGGILSATLTVDGAWINTSLRKLATPPALVSEVFETMPKDPEFQWL
jgi:acyl-CoA thioester hydrolase